jgi:hypothetical protein
MSEDKKNILYSVRVNSRGETNAVIENVKFLM